MGRDGLKIWLARPDEIQYWVIRYVDPETAQVRQKSTKTAKKKEAENRRDGTLLLMSPDRHSRSPSRHGSWRPGSHGKAEA